MTDGFGDDSGRSSDHRFPTAFRGYEASAVDACIEALESRLAEASRESSARIDALQTELAAMSARTAAREAAPGGLTAAEAQRLEAMAQSIVELLRAAHDEAAAVRERAQADSQAIVQHAEARLAEADRVAQDAASMRQRARAEAQEILEKAEVQAALFEAGAQHDSPEDDHPSAGPSSVEPSDEELTPGAPAAVAPAEDART